MSTTTIHIGSVSITCGTDLAQTLGYRPDGRWDVFSGRSQSSAVEALAAAVSAGLSDDLAVMNAISAIAQHNRESEARRSALEEADRRLHVARVERQTAVIQALAHRVPKAEIDRVLNGS